MARTVKVKDLQAGMRVVNPIVGKKGDVKVNSGEVLTKLHVDKLNKWHGVDAANPRGIDVETSTASGDLVPRVLDKPWESRTVNQAAKQKVHASMVVGVSFDKDGNIIRDEKDTSVVTTGEVRRTPEKSGENSIQGNVNAKPKRGRPKKG